MKNELMGFYTTFATVAGLILVLLEILSANQRFLYKVTLWLKPWLRNAYPIRTVAFSQQDNIEPGLVKLMMYKKRVSKQLSRVKKYFMALLLMCMSAIGVIYVHLFFVN